METSSALHVLKNDHRRRNKPRAKASEDKEVKPPLDSHESSEDDSPLLFGVGYYMAKESSKAAPPSQLKSSVPQTEKRFTFEVDLVAVALLALAFLTRFYRLEQPAHIVFDELHYGKYVSLYMKRTFFFDLHPPFGKQLISLAGYLGGYDGQFKFDRIGSPYNSSVPLFALRAVPAVCGSLIVPSTYYLMIEFGCHQWSSAIAALLILFDNAMLTQSRFILLESVLLLFVVWGLLFFLKFSKISEDMSSPKWWLYLSLTTIFLTLSVCVKYVGFFSLCLGVYLIWRDYWDLLPLWKKITSWSLIWQFICRCLILTVLPAATYISIFYVHLLVLNKAGPHDSVMTSAFQASLEGGLASITKGQPLEVAHGSQVTLRHTHGRACWLHSHSQVYPIRYPDNRGSSHQQQVTCYTFKDVNNWWIIKRPDKSNLVVTPPVDAIKHGDVIQLVHGITSRALNAHDVSAPMSVHNQEVSCYIDYNVSMPAQNLWKVDITNRDMVGDVWHTIESQVRLIHVNSSQALKYSGRQLPAWAFYQMEVVTDKVIHQDDTVWNVEEHRYTKSEDEKEREKEMVNAEMIPMRGTVLSFFSKFIELQYKILFPPHEDSIQNHMYSSEPLEWPLLTRGIAYWVSPHHNGQVHLIGNALVWYSGTISIFIYFSLFVFYLLRRGRQVFDLSPDIWNQFVSFGDVLFVGYLVHYVPYFFVDRTLFLHHYLPAFLFKVLLTAAILDHIVSVLRSFAVARILLFLFIVSWLLAIFYVFQTFSVLTYGTTPLTLNDIVQLRWKDTWDLIVHK